MTTIRDEEIEEVLSELEGGTQSIHVSGEPGVGKTTFLNQVTDEIPDRYGVSRITVREGHSPTTLTQDILHEVRGAIGRLRKFFGDVTEVSVGWMGFSGSLATESPTRHLQELESASSSVSSRNPVVVCIDDIQKLDDPAVTRDFLRDVTGRLGEHVQLISVGQLTFGDADYSIRLERFSREQTSDYLQREFPDCDPEPIDDVYNKIDGHPYYLGLLSEAASTEETFRVPETDARDFIENEYLDSMSEEEEEFIRMTSVLTELDEEICSAILEGVNRTQARRILNSLSDNAVVTELERSEDTGERVFSVHDLFREFLYGKLDNPDKLHRATFQYYAGKLYDAVKDSEAPPLDGFAFGPLAKIHLEAIYGDELSIEQIQSEMDELGLGVQERMRFVLGFGPYALEAEEDTSKILAYEFNDYCDRLRDIEPETEEENLKLSMYVILMDILRASQRSNADLSFEKSSQEIYEDTIKRIDELDFSAVTDDQNSNSTELLPDLLRVASHAAAHRDIEDEDQRNEHLTAAYDVLGKYGLNRTAVEGFLKTCREFVDEHEAGDQAEQFIESRVEEQIGQLEGDDVTRNSLMRVQSGLFDEIVEFANSGFTAVLTESESVLEFIHDCGSELEKADNPFFVAAWYSVALEAYQTFAPEAAATRELEESYQHFAGLRREYEEELRNPIIDIDGFDAAEVELPELIEEAAQHDEDSESTE